MFSVDSSWIPVDSGRNPPEFLEFRGIPGFRPESAEFLDSGRNPRNSWIPAGIRGIRPESVEEWKVLSVSMAKFTLALPKLATVNTCAVE